MTEEAVDVHSVSETISRSSTSAATTKTISKVDNADAGVNDASSDVSSSRPLLRGESEVVVMSSTNRRSNPKPKEIIGQYGSSDEDDNNHHHHSMKFHEQGKGNIYHII